MAQRARCVAGLRGDEGPMREKIKLYELTRTIDPAHFSRTLHGAVAECLRETDATWRSRGTAL